MHKNIYYLSSVTIERGGDYTEQPTYRLRRAPTVMKAPLWI